ncbi:MAG: DUF5678 domain-containing protein [Candidatus Nanohaloarchaea archaeon]|nr:DUF5678 domain-containing protein [Candidatus Nanohaloarchaea archaeon]
MGGAFSKEFKFVMDNELEDFQGKWVAVHGDEVISSGKSEESVRKEAEKEVGNEALITKI